MRDIKGKISSCALEICTAIITVIITILYFKYVKY